MTDLYFVWARLKLLTQRMGLHIHGDLSKSYKNPIQKEKKVPPIIFPVVMFQIISYVRCVMIERFKLILLALHVYECWPRRVGKVQIEQPCYQITNYNYVVRELL